MLGLAVLCFATPARSQSRSGETDEPVYTFAMVGVPLADALSELIDKTRINLLYETELVAGRTSFCRARQIPQEEVLHCLLSGTGLDFYRLSTGMYVLFADPEQRPRYAQLVGRVVDAETTEPLAYASVVLDGENVGTATNQGGRFSFAAVKPGRHRMVVTHVAYEDRVDTVWVDVDARNAVKVPMKARTILTSPIVITGLSSRLPSEDLGVGRRSYTELDGGVGPGDVVESINTIVGVRAGSVLSEVHVQGGASGEHQFLLDGATVFVPIQNGGFVGPFSPFAVQRVTVQKAGFGVTHGSHLSGVIDVEHRVAPRRRFESTVQVDPLSANARVSGRSPEQHHVSASWMVAGRRGLWGLLQPSRLERLFQSWSAPDVFLVDALRTAGELDSVTTEIPQPTTPADVGYTDLHAAGRVEVGGLHSINLSYYKGRNTFGEDLVVTAGADEYSWSNTTAQVRYEGVLGGRTFGHARAWLSSYEFVHPFDHSLFSGVGDEPGVFEPSTEEDFNDVAEFGVRAGLDYTLSGRHFLSGGLSVVRSSGAVLLSLNPFRPAPRTDLDKNRTTQWRFSAYVEDQLSLGRRSTLTSGVRLTHAPLLGDLFAEPRIEFRYDFSEEGRGTWAFRGAAGIYRQFVNQFDVATYGVRALVPTARFWIPVDEGLRPPKAYHFAAAVLFKPTGDLEFGVESFYKLQPHLLVLDYGGQVIGTQAPATSSPDFVTDGEGYAYGVAATASRKVEGARITAQYEYTKTMSSVANRFGGSYISGPWNIPHRVQISADVAATPRLTFTLRWQTLVGRTWGFRQAYYDFLEPNPETRMFAPFDLSDPGAHRLPAFVQLDVGAAYARVLRGVPVQARLGFINVLGRKNVRDWSMFFDEAAGMYARSERHSTPFVPSLALRVVI